MHNCFVTALFIHYSNPTTTYIQKLRICASLVSKAIIAVFPHGIGSDPHLVHERFRQILDFEPGVLMIGDDQMMQIEQIIARHRGKVMVNINNIMKRREWKAVNRYLRRKGIEQLNNMIDEKFNNYKSTIKILIKPKINDISELDIDMPINNIVFTENEKNSLLAKLNWYNNAVDEEYNHKISIGRDYRVWHLAFVKHGKGKANFAPVFPQDRMARHLCKRAKFLLHWSLKSYHIDKQKEKEEQKKNSQKNTVKNILFYIIFLFYSNFEK